jgi:predicted GNAT family N-acyltransferase
MFGVTYVALSSDINDSSIPRTHLPEEVLKGLPKYSDIPAMLIGRFAVDITFAGRGVGHVLMSHALTTCVLVSQISAARYVIIEAFDSAVAWYQKYGSKRFRALINQTGERCFSI